MILLFFFGWAIDLICAGVVVVQWVGGVKWPGVLVETRQKYHCFDHAPLIDIIFHDNRNIQ